jgi:predicted nicotinamide N-methyase
VKVIAGIRAVWRPIPAPGAPGFGAYVARDPDALLDEMDDESFRASDEKMPYFALLWPSGEALARAVLEGPRLEGRRVLDLGCGVGAPGLAAAVRGARVTFLDWEPRALDFVRASARRLAVAPEALVAGDWRTVGDRGEFDLVLGADVLYEARNAPAVAACLAGSLATGGEAWIADPSRTHAAGFPAEAGRAGLDLLETAPLPSAAEGPKVTRFRIGRAGGGRATRG